jgi:type IV pilus assembly protein PilW
MKHRSSLRLSPPCARARTGGFSLIELMVGLTIGLLLTAVVTMVFLENRRTLANQRDLSRVTQSGNEALSTVSRVLKQAGQVAWGGMASADQNNFSPPDFCETASAPTATGSWSVDGPFLQGTDNYKSTAPGKSDEITVRYFGSSGPGNDIVKPKADGSVVDCAGNAIEGPLAGGTGSRMGTRLYVGNDVDGIPGLFCENLTTPIVAQLIVPGVETFQVLYGVANANTRNEPAKQFVPAGKMAAADWHNVVSARIGLVVSGVDPTRSAIDTGTYDVFGSALVSTETPSLAASSLASDAQKRRIRQIYSTTVELRNSPYSVCRRG